MAVTARGLAKAAEILAGQFTLVATNVPYLGRGKQDEVLKDYCERVHPEAQSDLATCFVERCLDFCAAGGSDCARHAAELAVSRQLTRSFARTSARTSYIGISSRGLAPRRFETSMVRLSTCCLSLHHATAATTVHIDFVASTYRRTASPDEKATRSDRQSIAQVSTASATAEQSGCPNHVWMNDRRRADCCQHCADVCNGITDRRSSPILRNVLGDRRKSTDRWDRFIAELVEMTDVIRWDAAMAILLRMNERRERAVRTIGCRGQAGVGKSVALLSARWASFSRHALYRRDLSTTTSRPLFPKIEAHLACNLGFLLITEFDEAVRQIDQNAECHERDVWSKFPSTSRTGRRWRRRNIRTDCRSRFPATRRNGCSTATQRFRPAVARGRGAVARLPVAAPDRFKFSRLPGARPGWSGKAGG